MSIPETMRAVVLTGHGGLDELEYRDDWPVPDCGATDVLIRVAACGMNNTDVNTRIGWYSKQVTTGTTGSALEEADDSDPSWGGSSIALPRIQGADAVGTVVGCGADADHGLLGKRVMTDNWLRDWSDPLNRDKTGYFGSERDGGYAEYASIDHRNVRAIDSVLTDAELATFSCSYTTAEGMLERADAGPEDCVLITGASGGVGTALVQLAKLRGCTVVALASEEKHDRVAALGADAVLPRNPADLAGALRNAVGRERVSVVADVVGGDFFGTLIETLERGGRFTCSGAIAGPIVDLDLRTLYLNDLTFTGSTVLPPHVFGIVADYIERGQLRPLLARTYPLSEFRVAQSDFVEKKHFGNIVVVP